MYAKELAQLPSHINTLVTNENQELVMVYETLQICLRLKTPCTPQATPPNHPHPSSQSWSYGVHWSWLGMQGKVNQMVEVGKLQVWLSHTTLGWKLQTIHTPQTAAKASCYEVYTLYVLLVVLVWFCTLSTCIGI